MEEDNGSLNVILVQWTKQNLTKGRLVELDESNCLICPMNFVPARAFPQKHILIPCVGEGVRKVRKAHRPALPACPLRIMHMFSTAIQHHSASESAISFEDAGVSACKICSVATSDVLTCAWCLQSVHRACCSMLCDRDATGGVESWLHVDQQLTLDMMPTMFLAPSDHTTLASSSSSSSSSAGPSPSPWTSSVDCNRSISNWNGVLQQGCRVALLVRVFMNSCLEVAWTLEED